MHARAAILVSYAPFHPLLAHLCIYSYNTSAAFFHSGCEKKKSAVYLTPISLWMTQSYHLWTRTLAVCHLGTDRLSYTNLVCYVYLREIDVSKCA
jgi:hypothetical protein